MFLYPQVGTLLARERGHCEQVVNCLKISELVFGKLAVERYLKNPGVPHVWGSFVVNGCGKGRELLENELHPRQRNRNMRT